MTLHDHRGRFERHLTPFVEWCADRDINPNLLTVVALLAAAAAGVCFWSSSGQAWWLLVVGSGFLSLGAVLDSADGLLARATGRATELGDYLDHALDRFADVLLLLGLTFSPWVRLEVGLFAIIGTLLTSYMGTQAQAVGVGRDYGGLLGRADRMFVLFFAALGQALFVVAGLQVPWGTTLLEAGVGWIALAGNVTALQRFWAAYKALREDRTKPK